MRKSVVLSQLKRLRDTESQFLPVLDKNKRLSKKNEELALSVRRLGNKLRFVTQENMEIQSMVNLLLLLLHFETQVNIIPQLTSTITTAFTTTKQIL